MGTVIIIGSGAAAAGAALALSQRTDLQIKVVDIGLQLELDRRNLVDDMAKVSPHEWDAEMVESISRLDVDPKTRGIPQKRSFGSNYPFRDVGQINGLTAINGATTSLISSAYGGFSNVWGSQLMPFTREAFESWPIRADVMQSHYDAVLNHLPFSGEEDDLATNFPLIHAPAALPPMSARSLLVLKAYQEHRSKLNCHGITVGKARLALDAEKCVLCGMCMTGCPYGLIYSAAQTFNELRRDKKVTHYSGFLALKIVEENSKVVVIAKEIATEQIQRFEADRVYVACGAIGTTRLVANSLGLFNVDLAMLESQQFVLPSLSSRATEDPRQGQDFTLNQFNMIVAPDGGSVNLSQLHFYTFNSGFVDGLPSVLRAKSLEWIQVQLLRRLTVAFGYLPSWSSPQLRMHIGSAPRNQDLPNCHISAESAPADRNRMLYAVMLRLIYSARLLDLYPVIPMLRLSPGGKSYHWGGSFPHSSSKSAVLESDRIGRVGSWDRIHLVDASVFPTIPAMTFGLTIMANAHRIASETLGLIA